MIKGDSFRLFVPLEKSIDMDGAGDYIVEGVMSSDDTDEQNDSITPAGMDTSYFLDKGWIKWEHGNTPDQFIGEPLDVRIGEFQHPVTQKSINGVYLKGKLYANRNLTMQAVVAMEDLQKSQSSRRVGWSIEGGVVERCKQTGKILKSVLRNVVLTMNPVNTVTYAELVKSFNQGDETYMTTNNQDPQGQESNDITVALAGLSKSMTQIIKQNGETQELVKSLTAENSTLKTEVEELRKSLDQPQGRKSYTSQRDPKSFTRPQDGDQKTHKEILEVLEKSFEEGELGANEVIRFESGTPLSKLSLPASVKEKLGV
ncbi:hypothetical protein [Paenibacillus hunanensis]|uniref:Regulator of replication initiation timing n=1 Tax=Paenibacillus hunanensis TaxID=539262 RepID=A0ABU1IVB5_9BACL|nr:hypothetical protein [Paenibacillus hunanensis]MDR6243156.1 regulator of replication initiation timing [Paenibacillus hunanensis]GGJ11385.1 hypothetical protein GCM10008022_20690 [Paenibacillus hunanensis]